MVRPVVVALAVCLLASQVSAQCCVMSSPAPVMGTTVYVSTPVYGTPMVGAPASGGLFAPGSLIGQLNAPIVSGLPSVPGLPTPSVLGILAPRASFAVSFLQGGGFAGPNATGLLLGLLAPRIAPLYALSQGTITAPQALTATFAPRVAAALPLVQQVGGGFGGGFGNRFGGGFGCRRACR